jgi:hypothetical protein
MPSTPASDSDADFRFGFRPPTRNSDSDSAIAMEHEGGRVVSDEHGESDGCRVGHDVERAKKGVAEASWFLIVRHVGARLEPHERFAAGSVERIHVAGDEVWGRGEVVSTLEEGYRDLDPRDDCP